MDKMTNDERLDKVIDIVIELRYLRSDDRINELYQQLQDLKSDLTKSEREYPMGEWELFTDLPLPTGCNDQLNSGLKIRSGIYLWFTTLTDKPTRRMFEKARESYEDDKAFMSLVDTMKQTIVSPCSDIVGRMAARIKYIETGADNG